jgi:hypothetical protein
LTDAGRKNPLSLTSPAGSPVKVSGSVGIAAATPPNRAAFKPKSAGKREKKIVHLDSMEGKRPAAPPAKVETPASPSEKKLAPVASAAKASFPFRLTSPFTIACLCPQSPATSILKPALASTPRRGKGVPISVFVALRDFPILSHHDAMVGVFEEDGNVYVPVTQTERTPIR